MKLITTVCLSFALAIAAACEPGASGVPHVGEAGAASVTTPGEVDTGEADGAEGVFLSSLEERYGELLRLRRTEGAVATMSLDLGGGANKPGMGHAMAALKELGMGDIWDHVQYGAVLVIDADTWQIVGTTGLIVGGESQVALAEPIAYNAMEHRHLLFGVALFDGQSAWPVAAGFDTVSPMPGYEYQAGDLHVDIEVFLTVVSGISVD